MAQELIKANIDNAQQIARLSTHVGSLYAGIERDERRRCDTLPAAISLDVRKELQNYRRDLHSRLQPIGNSVAHREKAQSAIALFLGSYLNARTNDPAGTSRAYVAMLLDQPLFAILAALDDFKNRRVVDHYDAADNPIYFTIDHAPSGPRILDQVKKCAAGLQGERHKVTRLLSISVIRESEVSDAQRERVGKLMRELADSLAMKNAHIREEEIKNIRAEADEARARAARIRQEGTERRRREQAADAG